MTRYKAFLIHFSLSVFIIFSFLSFVYFVWYGQIYLDLSGVIEPTKIMIGVDVILGPLLTLLLFKSGKKHLKLDLFLIAVVQVAALIYGAYTLFLGKPTLVVLNDDVFEVITQKNIKNELSQQLKNNLSVFNQPLYAAVKPEELDNQRSVFMQQASLIPIKLNESWVVGKQVSVEVAQRQLNIKKSDFEQLLSDEHLVDHGFYLVRDTFLNALLVVKDNVPVRILHTEK